ncbi:MAG: STAS domain-containing protein [Acidimicrobiia bacterium]
MPVASCRLHESRSLRCLVGRQRRRQFEGRSEVFEIRVDPPVVRGRVHVHVAGEIDLSTASRLERVVQDHPAVGTETFVVHLTAVTFADSSAVHCLVRLHKLLGDRLVLSSPSERVRQLLEISGLLGSFRTETPN